MEVSRIDQAIEAINRALDAPPPTIQEAVAQAVTAGRMTIKEAQECVEAYLTRHPEVSSNDAPPDL